MLSPNTPVFTGVFFFFAHNLRSSRLVVPAGEDSCYITRGTILRGAGLTHFWLDGLALYDMGTILLLIAARRFQNKVIMG